jgi:putative endopeptidase
VAPDIPVDGNFTLGENIADQGGLRIAEIAYEEWLKENAASASRLPALGFSHRQLFYLGYALPWCATHSDAMMRNGKTVHAVRYERFI